MAKSKKQSKVCTACLGLFFPCAFLLGAVCIGGAVAFYLEYPSIINSQVDKRVTVEEGHATYEQLQNPTIKIYKNFYFFNWTNFHEFAKSGGAVKPNLEEKGPYSFIEKRTKSFIPTDDKDWLNYTQTKLFFYDLSTSGTGLSDSDIIYTINIALVAAIGQVKDSKWKEGLLWIAMKSSSAQVYIRQNVTALAWGYTDNFIGYLHSHHKYPRDNISIQINNSMEDRKISTINTGVSNISHLGQFKQWDGNDSLTIWFGSEANQIRGTEGFFFKPHLQETDNLTVFVDDTVRSFDLVYQERINHLGLEALRYVLDNTTFKSAFSEPKNAQYGSWCPDGLSFLGPTQVVKQTPVFGSKPHFLDGDPLLLESVDGLKPDREKHDTVLDVEPITGANIFFKRQLQVNVQVNKTKTRFFKQMNNIKGYNNSGVLYMPVLYVSESAEIDQGFKDYLEGKGLHLVQMFDVIAPVVFGLLIFCGAVLFLVGILTCLAWARRMKSGSRRADELAPLLGDDN